jgi:hypothetical protein
VGLLDWIIVTCTVLADVRLGTGWHRQIVAKADGNDCPDSVSHWLPLKKGFNCSFAFTLIIPCPRSANAQTVLQTQEFESAHLRSAQSSPRKEAASQQICQRRLQRFRVLCMPNKRQSAQ